MPHLGSVLNTPMEMLEKAIVEREHELANVRRMLIQLDANEKDIQKQIEGYRLAYEVLLQKSNEI